MMKNSITCLKLTFFRNSSQENLGVLRDDFLGFGCPKDGQIDALLAKTMGNWLHLKIQGAHFQRRYNL